MAKIVKGTQTDKWLPKNWRKSTFPILCQPAKTLNDITGTAFLIDYKSIPYIVTASHVIESENPVIAFATKNTQLITVSTALLQRAELRWVKHPAGIDISAIPLHLPLSIIKELDLVKITEGNWNPQPKIKLGDPVAHLGYPQRGTSNYLNGSPCLFPQAMPGNIIALSGYEMTMRTAAAHGASGGPVLLRTDNNGPKLIGIVTQAKMKGQPTRPSEVQYCNETKAIIVSLIKDILESEQMKEQYNHRFIGPNWL
jgi:S1-C subfamily serine protease